MLNRVIGSKVEKSDGNAKQDEEWELLSESDCITPKSDIVTEESAADVLLDSEDEKEYCEARTESDKAESENKQSQSRKCEWMIPDIDITACSVDALKEIEAEKALINIVLMRYLTYYDPAFFTFSQKLSEPFVQPVQAFDLLQPQSERSTLARVMSVLSKPINEGTPLIETGFTEAANESAVVLAKDSEPSVGRDSKESVIDISKEPSPKYRLHLNLFGSDTTHFMVKNAASLTYSVRGYTGSRKADCFRR